MTDFDKGRGKHEYTDCENEIRIHAVRKVFSTQSDHSQNPTAQTREFLERALEIAQETNVPEYEVAIARIMAIQDPTREYLSEDE